MQFRQTLFRFVLLSVCLIGLVLLLPNLRAQARTLSNAPLAVWTGTANNGLNGKVLAIAVHGTDVYVGGEFTGTTDETVSGLNRIARWDGAAWHPLGLGLNNTVFALAFDSQNRLYVGGRFDATCLQASCGGSDVKVAQVAMWDGAQWNSVGFGLRGEVEALTVDSNDNLYAGGSFVEICGSSTCTGNTVANRVAKWNGTTWKSLAFGLNASVNALAVAGDGTLYAGGNFFEYCADAACIDDTGTDAASIAKFSNGAWSALPLGGLDGDVKTLAFMSNTLYVGGSFTDTQQNGGAAVRRLAKFSSNTWSALPNNGLNNTVSAIAVNGNDLYVSGAFVQTEDGGIALPHIARFSSGVWKPMPNTGLNAWTYALATHNHNLLFAGGNFSATADGTVTELGHIAQVQIPNCIGKPAKPLLIKPQNGKVSAAQQIALKWQAVECASTYTVIVNVFGTGTLADKATGLTQLKYKTDALTSGVQYQWFVKACNSAGCTKSAKRTFTVQ